MVCCETMGMVGTWILAWLAVIVQSLSETPTGLRQVFHDDFKYLDHDKWSNEIAASGFGNGEFQIYSPEQQNCYVKNGQLFLRPTLTADRFGKDFLYNGTLNIPKMYGSCTHATNNGCYRKASRHGIMPPVMSCKLKSKVAIRYGRVEVWAKLPRGDWLWPAIWLMPTENKYGHWPRSGEIDVMESRGNQNFSGGTPSKISSTIHFGPDPDFDIDVSMSITRLSSRTFADDFHKYVLDWTATHIRVYVDDVIVLNHTTPSNGYFHHYIRQGENPWSHGSTDAPFDQEFYVIFNVAVGGTRGWFKDGMKNFPHPKPWVNTEGHATSMEKFWRERDHWYSTWHGEEAAMIVRSITMWTY